MAYFRCGGGGGGFTTITLPVASKNIVNTGSDMNPTDAWLSVYPIGGVTYPMTDFSETEWTYTATEDTTIWFSSGCAGNTSVSRGEGYIELLKNGTSIYKKYLAQYALTDMSDFPSSIDLASGDTLEIVYGWDTSHWGSFTEFYANIAITT